MLVYGEYILEEFRLALSLKEKYADTLKLKCNKMLSALMNIADVTQKNVIIFLYVYTSTKYFNVICSVTGCAYQSKSWVSFKFHFVECTGDRTVMSRMRYLHEI